MGHDLKWTVYISNLRKRLSKRITGIHKIRKILPFQTLKIITEGWFNSVLAYCLPLFGGCDVSDMNDLQVLQNKVARLITFSESRTPRIHMFEKLQWLSVNQLIFYHTVLTVYRIRQSEEPEYLASKLTMDN